MHSLFLLLQYIFYVPVKITWLSGHKHMYKLTNVIIPDKILIQKSFLLDTIHFDWQCMCLHMNGQPVTLPATVTIPLKDKIRVHHMLAKEVIDLQFMIKQDSNWYSLNKSVQTQYLTDYA